MLTDHCSHNVKNIIVCFFVSLGSLIFNFQAQAETYGEKLPVGQIVYVSAGSPCVACSPSGAYVVSGIYTVTTSSWALASYSDFNYTVGLKEKQTDGILDVINVYTYEGSTLGRTWTNGTYSFLKTSYLVQPLEGLLNSPSNAERFNPAIASTTRLATIQTRISSNQTGVNAAFKNMSSVRAAVSDQGTLSKTTSFFIGSLTAIAFVIASKLRF